MWARRIPARCRALRKRWRLRPCPARYACVVSSDNWSSWSARCCSSHVSSAAPGTSMAVMTSRPGVMIFAPCWSPSGTSTAPTTCVRPAVTEGCSRNDRHRPSVVASPSTRIRGWGAQRNERGASSPHQVISSPSCRFLTRCSPGASPVVEWNRNYISPVPLAGSSRDGV